MVLRKAGYPDLTVHGFRSTFRDWAAECTAYPGEVCEMALAHAISDKAEAAYLRALALDPASPKLAAGLVAVAIYINFFAHHWFIACDDPVDEALLRIEDRLEREMLFGPTNEEMVTDIFKQFAKSYRDLPRNLYHIQWKFRDEVRPRFGVMRGREFLMKDAYSFDMDFEGAKLTASVPGVFLPRPGTVLWLMIRRDRCFVFPAHPRS